MAISIVGTGSDEAGPGTSITVPLPGGWQQDDVAILGVAGNPSTQVFTKPSGWTQVQDETANNLRFYLAYRVLQTGDSDPVIQQSANNQMAGAVIVLRGADTADLFGTASAYVEDAAGADADCEFPALTPRNADDFVVWVGATRASSSTATNHTTVPTGGTGGTVTEQVDISSVSTGPEVGIAIFTQQLSAATAISASTTTVTVTGNSAAHAFGIKTATAVGPNEGTASGGYDFTGAASGERSSGGTAAGSYSFAGTAAGERASEGTVTGAYDFTGSAAGERASEGTASGSYDFTGTATGSAVDVPTGSASGGYAFAGTAVGEHTSSGTASGTYSFAGSAAGEHVSEGTASGGYSFSGSATGAERPAVSDWSEVASATTLSGQPSGQASGGYDFSGTAAGSVVHEGTASGSFTFTGTAVGSAPGTAQGQVAGGFDFTGSATGSAPRRGTASGSVSWAGSAEGGVQLEGSAAGSYTFAGSAAGEHTTYEFTPPTYRKPLIQPSPALRRGPRLSLDQGVSIVRIDGALRITRSPSPTQLRAAGEEGEDWFIGGHEYRVSAETLAELTAGGFV